MIEKKPWMDAGIARTCHLSLSLSLSLSHPESICLTAGGAGGRKSCHQIWGKGGAAYARGTEDENIWPLATLIFVQSFSLFFWKMAFHCCLLFPWESGEGGEQGSSKEEKKEEWAKKFRREGGKNLVPTISLPLFETVRKVARKSPEKNRNSHRLCIFHKQDFVWKPCQTFALAIKINKDKRGTFWPRCPPYVGSERVKEKVFFFFQHFFFSSPTEW